MEHCIIDYNFPVQEKAQVGKYTGGHIVTHPLLNAKSPCAVAMIKSVKLLFLIAYHLLILKT